MSLSAQQLKELGVTSHEELLKLTEKLMNENANLKKGQVEDINFEDLPRLDSKDKDGNVLQTQLDVRLVSQGGAWYTVAHLVETNKGEKVMYMRKYQKVREKNYKTKEYTGKKKFANKSSFKIKSLAELKEFTDLAKEFGLAKERGTKKRTRTKKEEEATT